MRVECVDFVLRALDSSQIEGKDVLETGALNYNGSIRLFIEALKPSSYLATDMQAGKGVDLVLKAEEFLPDTADLVLSIEMLEHAEDWRAACLGLAGAVRPGGYLLITVPGPQFPRHNAPGDYQRFTVKVMQEIMDALGMEVVIGESVSSWSVFMFKGKALHLDLSSINFLARKTGIPNFEMLNSITPEEIQDYDGLVIT